MALSVTFLSFSKRRNSTAIPSQSAVNAGFTTSVVLKDGCSIVNPVFFIRHDADFSYNYAVFKGNYYFVTNVDYTLNDRITVSCRMDSLGSLRSYIAGTSAFVAYDTTSNTEIIDSRLSAKTTQTTERNSATGSVFGAGSCAIVTITGKNSTGAFAFSQTGVGTLLNQINNWMDGVDILPVPADYQPTGVVGNPWDFEPVIAELRTGAQNLIRMGRQLVATGNANECIRSATIVPIPYSAVGGSSTVVYLGQYNTAISAPLVAPSALKAETLTVSIPWQATDWRRNSPYHELYLAIPYVGVVQLSPSDVMGESSISMNIEMNIISGDAVIMVRTSTKKLMQFSVNLSAPLALGSSNITGIQAGSAIASMIGGAAAVAAAATPLGAAAAGSAAIVGAASHIVPTLSTVGSRSGGITGAIPCIFDCISVYHDTNVSPGSVSGVIGTPAMASKSLGSLSGYIECRCASVAAPYPAPILEEVNGYINSGFFME